MALTNLSMIDFGGNPPRWVAVVQVDAVDSVDLAATGTTCRVHDVRMAAVSSAASTDVIRGVLQDSSANFLWSGAAWPNGGAVGVNVGGIECDGLTVDCPAVAGSGVAEMTVVFDFVSGTAPTAV